MKKVPRMSSRQLLRSTVPSGTLRTAPFETVDENAVDSTSLSRTITPTITMMIENQNGTRHPQARNCSLTPPLAGCSTEIRMKSPFATM